MPSLLRRALAAFGGASLCLAQGVTVPYVESFESPTWPGTEWALAFSDPVGRIQALTPSPASPVGGLAAHFDTNTNSVFSTNSLTLAVDLTGAPAVSLLYWAKETSDETHPEDGLFLAASAAGPFVKVVDHATLTSSWQSILVDLNSVAAANGLALGAGFQIRFQQRDNFPSNSDGLQIDGVSLAFTPTGQANATDAAMTLNGGRNDLGAPANAGTPGPFFASAAPGAPFNLAVSGPANRPYALLMGPLGPDNVVLPFGSLDLGLGGASNLFDVVILLDGNQPGFLNQLANTGPTGASTFSTTTPALPPGVWTAFQALVFVDPVTIKFTAATQFAVL
jgi:hypothetical protein